MPGILIHARLLTTMTRFPAFNHKIFTVQTRIGIPIPPVFLRYYIHPVCILPMDYR